MGGRCYASGHLVGIVLATYGHRNRMHGCLCVDIKQSVNKHKGHPTAVVTGPNILTSRLDIEI